MEKRGTAVKSVQEKGRIYLSSPHMSDEGYEKAFIEAAFASNWIAPCAANIDALEKELPNYVGA